MIAIAVPSFLNQQNKAYDIVARQNLAVAYRSAKSDNWVENSAYSTLGDPGDSTDTTLFGSLDTSEPEFTFAEGISSDTPNQIEVVHVSSQVVVFADEAKDGNIFCLEDVEEPYTDPNGNIIHAGLYYSEGTGYEACGDPTNPVSPPPPGSTATTTTGGGTTTTTGGGTTTTGGGTTTTGGGTTTTGGGSGTATGTAVPPNNPPAATTDGTETPTGGPIWGTPGNNPSEPISSTNPPEATNPPRTGANALPVPIYTGQAPYIYDVYTNDPEEKEALTCGDNYVTFDINYNSSLSAAGAGYQFQVSTNPNFTGSSTYSLPQANAPTYTGFGTTGTPGFHVDTGGLGDDNPGLGTFYADSNTQGDYYADVTADQTANYPAGTTVYWRVSATNGYQTTTHYNMFVIGQDGANSNGSAPCTGGSGGGGSSGGSTNTDRYEQDNSSVLEWYNSTFAGSGSCDTICQEITQQVSASTPAQQEAGLLLQETANTAVGFAQMLASQVLPSDQPDGESAYKLGPYVYASPQTPATYGSNNMGFRGTLTPTTAGYGFLGGCPSSIGNYFLGSSGFYDGTDIVCMEIDSSGTNPASDQPIGMFFKDPDIDNGYSSGGCANYYQDNGGLQYAVDQLLSGEYSLQQPLDSLLIVGCSTIYGSYPALPGDASDYPGLVSVNGYQTAMYAPEQWTARSLNFQPLDDNLVSATIPALLDVSEINNVLDANPSEFSHLLNIFDAVYDENS